MAADICGGGGVKPRGAGEDIFMNLYVENMYDSSPRLDSTLIILKLKKNLS